MAEIKCPVCGKTGIQDYRLQDTICPQCGADLSIYKLAQDIKNAGMPPGGKGPMAWIIPAAIACCLTIALIFTTLKFKESEKQKAVLLARVDEDLKEYKKQNAVFQARVDELEQALEKANYEPRFVYTVRRGDSFWLISKKLYGTGTRYREIALANELPPESILSVGDKLIIK